MVKGKVIFEDEEKIELTESILNAYPEVSNIMYEGFDIDDEEEFNYQVLNGEIYERYYCYSRTNWHW